MSSVDHLHAEANMLKVKEHSELLSAQYLARCLEPENVNFSITTREPPKRMMKETLFTRHRSAVEPLMIAKDRKTTLQAIHTMVPTISAYTKWNCLATVYNYRCQQIEINTYPDSPLFISTGFLPRVSSMRLN